MGIIAKNVTKTIEGRKILDDVSLEIKDGDFVSFLAPTGEGKTTLLRILAGIERVEQGRIYCDGNDVTGMPVQKRRVAMVYQWFVNYPSMTVYENIATPLRAVRPKIRKEEIDQRVGETARLLKIDHLMGHYPSQISGGQQQRLAVARALVKRADYVFLDEPLTNLDYKLQEELRVELKNIFSDKQRGAVIFATPQPIEALSLSTHVGFLHKGRLMQYGPVDEVYHQPSHVEVGAYFSHPAMNVLECRLVRENKGWYLKVSEQLKLRVDQFRDLLTNERYLLGLRASGLGAQRHSEEDIPIDAKVVLREVVGSDSELHLDHQGISLVALQQGITDLSIGQELTVFISPKRFMIFDHHTHQLIARV